MPFVKGQSGNPEGRRREKPEFKELAKKAAPAALKFCISLLKDKKVAARDRLKAAELVMDRAWGKPTQPLTGEDGGPVVLILDDLTKGAKNE